MKADTCSYKYVLTWDGPGLAIQGSTLTRTCSPLESKIDSMKSEKSQLAKNTCPIRQVVFYSLESSFWCSNRLGEKLILEEIRK